MSARILMMFDVETLLYKQNLAEMDHISKN
jgi:hypothetical protein